MNKRTTALTTEQYREIITTMKDGGAGFRPNERIATALVLEGNLGLGYFLLFKVIHSVLFGAGQNLPP